MTAVHDTLVALDFATIGCQCHVHPCAGTAGFIVETHAVCHCNDPGLNPFGNRVQLLCGACLARLRKTIATEVALLVAVSRGPVTCETCGAPVSRPGDVLRAVAVLK